MSERRFDQFTRAIADTASRRGIVQGIIGTLSGGLWAALGRGDAEAKKKKKCKGSKKKCKNKCCKKHEPCCNGTCCTGGQVCVDGLCQPLS